MTDAIGQSLEIGDFVTAVWANAAVALFEIVDLQENNRISSNYRSRRGDVVFLKRLFKTAGIKEETQEKIVKKLHTQVTKVNRDAVMMFRLSS